MSLAIVVFGIIGYTYLGVREFPSVDPPIITVTTTYIGANADVIESQITEPLEESINGIAGIRTTDPAKGIIKLHIAPGCQDQVEQVLPE